MTKIVFLGSYGYGSVQLSRAREILVAEPAVNIEILDIAYPGQGGAERAASLGQFLENVDDQLAAIEDSEGGRRLLYAHGIGALIALCLRARGRFTHWPMIFQAPYLWGLETERFPTGMRLGGLALRNGMLRVPWMQDWFFRRYLEDMNKPDCRREFFRSFLGDRAHSDLRKWMNSALLRFLEGEFARMPQGLSGIQVWLGGRDRWVTENEISLTQHAVPVIPWPVKTFPSWGHYPMLEDARGWLGAIHQTLGELEEEAISRDLSPS